MSFSEFLKKGIVYLDGAMGTELQKRGLGAGESPERWNLDKPCEIEAVHRAYFDAGCNVVSANTFGANLLHFTEDELEAVISSAMDIAKRARENSAGEQEKFVALDIGPCGKMLAPLGDYPFESAVELFANTVRLGVKHGAELVIIETMNDSYETKAALLAVKENCTLPVIVTNAYSDNGALMTGASPEAMVAMLEGMGADAMGANCSLGPKQLMPVIKKIVDAASVPVVVKPNAGLPRSVDGKTVFDVNAEEFALDIKEMISLGARVVGGCCGTTPEHIRKAVECTANTVPAPIEKKTKTVISSGIMAVDFDNTVLIGERINPTGKKRFKQALAENDMSYILNEGIKQSECGAHVLDVNVGLPEIDEADMLKRAVCELQAVCDLPLQIDTSNALAMEGAMRVYNGKPLVNSVNGKKESMHAVFPLVKKYGGAVIALALDEDGIPETAEGRFEIAKRILAVAGEYGIDKKDIIFDTLAMAVSADKNAASVTLEAIKRIKDELGCKTSLGVSNISFGLPEREALNSTFFSLALANGLSAAIMNPYSAEMMRVYCAHLALTGADDDFKHYISSVPALSVTKSEPKTETANVGFESELANAICKGLKDDAAKKTAHLLNTKEPLCVVNEEIIPALDAIGKAYEEKRAYLPQLLMSAEAAKASFEIIKARLSATGEKAQKGSIVLATVEGDIHDIGKNIVKLLLENYGFHVIDLGRDVSPARVLDAVKENGIKLVGLSALMTTTVPAMEKTIKLLNTEAPDCKIVVGGAVLTADYAEKIGADKYCADAMQAVRYAEEVFLG